MMSAIQSLVVNSVWVVGLAGLLATISYIDWYRTVQKWTFREAFIRPVALFPLNASLACFCGGLLLSELFFTPITFETVRWGIIWKPLLWAIFTVYFIYHAVQAAQYGRRDGWDKPITLS